MNFVKFRDLINKQAALLIAAGPVFRTSISKDEMYDIYLSSFRPEDNPIKVERTEHDCNCCKSFIRRMGNMVGVIDGKIQSIWDVKSTEEGYQIVADAMANAVKSRQIDTVYISDEPRAGAPETKSLTESGLSTYNHFYFNFPSELVNPVNRGKLMGEARDYKVALERAITEFDKAHVEIVWDLIDDKLIERHNEYKPHIDMLKKAQVEYEAAEDKQVYLWIKSVQLGRMSTMRNTPIGELLSNLADGDELEVAVNKYEKMVSGENFKRSKALATPGMIKKAAARVAELGLEDALHRTHCTINDVTINNVLFADRTAKEDMGVFDSIMGMAKTKAPELSDVQDVTIDHFLEKILPKAESLELLVENDHTGNFMTLISSKFPNSGNLFKWNNDKSWFYNGDYADTVLRDRVTELGGRIDGVLRGSFSWNNDGQNQSLMDGHMFLPGNTMDFSKNQNSNYGNNSRVGWNRRKDHATRGVQDVDYTQPPGDMVPVENITFPDINRLPDGKYTYAVNNWDLRVPNKSGFIAEVQAGDIIRQYTYPGDVKNYEWIPVADIIKTGNKFEVIDRIPSNNISKEIWGINTQKFVKVDMVMLSPNYWDGQEIGNKHFFFILDGCKNPDPVRGFYNEFLRSDLLPERKVFEMLGSKTKAPYSDQQLSGLGFPSTKRGSVVCKVRGSFNRTVKINF